jgi:hypothetical protein
MVCRSFFHYFLNLITSAVCYTFSPQSAKLLLCKREILIFRLHGDKKPILSFLGCKNMWTCTQIQTFLRNALPPSSTLKSTQCSCMKWLLSRCTGVRGRSWPLSSQSPEYYYISCEICSVFTDRYLGTEVTCPV